MCDLTGVISSERTVTKGVPQDSVLGLLLFSLYLTDFCGVLRYCKYNFYADDLLIYMQAEPEDLSNEILKINEDITRVVDWVLNNELTLNAAKTSAMILGTARYINSMLIDASNKRRQRQRPI